MRKWLTFLLALVLLAFLHEGTHALVAGFFGEYDAFHVHPYGFEVTFNTPVEQRAGMQWAWISGMSNAVTILLGYVLLTLRKPLGSLRNLWAKGTFYYLTFAALLVDALNLSVGPFLYGGDANGIAVGLGVNRLVIQLVFLVVFLVNHELLARELLPAYGVESDHPLLRPWLPSSR